MEQRALTLEGMKRGVAESDVFLLVLTESVLTRWFCQQEILEAVRLKKPILLLVEEDPRFKHFPLAAWRREDRSLRMTDGSEVPVRGFTADSPEAHAAICAAVDSALPTCVAHRRRDFEADAMLRALCIRAGIAVLPDTDPLQAPNPAADSPLAVAVIACRLGLGGDMAGPLLEALRGALSPGLVLHEDPDPAALASADKVLVLLSEGALSGSPLSQLVEALNQDDAAAFTGGKRSRLVLVSRAQGEGWSFGLGNPEIAAAPQVVRAALNDHEAVTYREPSQGASSHEFPAVVAQVCKLLSRRVSPPSAVPPGGPIDTGDSAPTYSSFADLMPSKGAVRF